MPNQTFAKRLFADSCLVFYELMEVTNTMRKKRKMQIPPQPQKFTFPTILPNHFKYVANAKDFNDDLRYVRRKNGCDSKKHDFSDTLITFDGRGRPNVFNKLLAKSDGTKYDYYSEKTGSDDESSDSSIRTTQETCEYLKGDEHHQVYHLRIEKESQN